MTWNPAGRPPAVLLKKGWEIKESLVTPREVYLNRRELMAGAIGAASLLGWPEPARAAVPRNPRYTLDREVTPKKDATTYNNFYEFGSSKEISKAAQELVVSPWEIEITGMVNQPRTIAIEDLMSQVTLEERLYRFRCVETWAMAVPWSGFPMSRLLEIAEPLSSAKYVAMTTAVQRPQMIGLRQFWYPWPYVEGLTIAEAANELTLMVTGIYGEVLPKQNGAPLRLVVPWKYGFKSIKSIVKFEFTDKRPISFWETIQAQEYGFWANVNPEVPHRRWSQARERMLGTGENFDTQLFNGYGEFVADLYTDIADDPNTYM